ncbi:MAG: helix-turn-helix domain-containing protein [Chloroflexota bacterium]
MNAIESLFFGRERIMRDIVQGVLAPQPSSFSLVGSKLCGKSKIIRYLASELGPFHSHQMTDWRPSFFEDAGRLITILIDCDYQDAQENLLLHVYTVLVQQLQEKERIELTWREIEAQPGMGRRLWTVARELKEMDYRLILLFDNFDSVFERQLISMDAVDELRPLTMELGMVVATEQPLHDLDRDLAASPLFNVMTQVFIGLIEPEAAINWLDVYAETYPMISKMKEPLLAITGAHPFLLRRIDDILLEIEQMFPQNNVENEEGLADEILPFIRLRLAEHGRLLFATLWRKVQAPPPPVKGDIVLKLLNRLIDSPLAISQIGREHFSTANWLINQAILRVSADGYQIFSPLFSEFIRSKVGVAENPSTPFVTLMPHAGEADIYKRLTKIESALLRYFEAHSHKVVSAEQLLTDVWKRPDASTRRVQEAIRRLRLQLEEDDAPYGVIENDRGRGYRFVPA